MDTTETKDQALLLDREFKPKLVKGLGFNDITQDPASSGVWQSEVNAFLDAQTLKSTFFNEDWNFIVVDLIAEHFSSSPMKLYEEKIEQGEVVKDIVSEHPIYDMFERPNPFQDYHSWQYNWAVEYLLMGNAIEWWSESNSIALVIPAETVMLDFNKEGELSGYMVSRRTDEIISRGLMSDMTLFDKDMIFHQMRPNPSSLLWGLSPFLAIRKSVLFNRYTQDYLNEFYLKGATPGVILKMDKNVAEDTALRFLRSFEAAHTGRRNSRRTVILPKGVDFDTASHTIADQQISDLTDKNKDKILAALKVPKHAVSLAESGSLGSEEHKMALRFFFKSAIVPVQKKRASFLTMKLRERGVIQPNQCIEFDNSHVEFLQDDQEKKADLGIKLNGQWTLNEIRQEIWQKEPIEGGDVVVGMQSPFQAPVQMSLPTAPEVKEETPVVESEVKADLEEDISFKVDEKTAIERKAMSGAVKEVLKDHVEYSQKEMGREIDNKENDLMELFLERFARQLEEVYLPVVKEELDKLPKREEKAETDVPRRLNVKKIRSKTETRLRKLDEELLNKDFEDFVNILEPTTERSYGTMFNPLLAPDKIDALEVLRSQNASGRRTTLEERGIRSFENIDSTTTEKVLNVVESGVQQRKTIVEIGKDISQKFIEISESRAQTIARTETLTAVSIGKGAAIDDMEEVFEGEKIVKLWLTANDEKVRATHDPLDGAVENSKDVFDNGLRYPRDPRGEASETINCRCDVMAIPEENLEDLDIKPPEFV